MHMVDIATGIMMSPKAIMTSGTRIQSTWMIIQQMISEIRMVSVFGSIMLL